MRAATPVRAAHRNTEWIAQRPAGGRRRPWIALAAVTAGAVLCAAPGSAAVLTVGSDLTACDFTSLQPAIAAAASGDVLRLQAMTFQGGSGSNFNISSKSLTIQGGYADCEAVSATGISTLMGGGLDTVIEIFGSGEHFVLLEDLLITGGEDDNNDGGGILIQGEFDVTLLRVTVSQNESDRGAGIFVNGSAGATLFVGDASVLSDNEAAVAGGGLYCENGGSVRFQAPVRVTENTSLGDGGGLWVGSGCDVELYGEPALNGSVLVDTNNAAGDGGGIYVTGGASVFGQGESTQLVQININKAGTGAGVGVGGGVYASGFGSRFDLDRGIVFGNSADQGGGIYATVDVEVSLFASGPCKAPSGFCSVVYANRAPFGAGMAALDGASVDLELTWVLRNGPPFGETGEAPIAFVTSGGELRLEGCVVAENEVGVGAGTGGIVDLGGAVRVAGTTFFANSGFDHLFWVGGQFSGGASIFDATEGDLFNLQSPVSWSLDCAVASAGLTLPAGATNVAFGDSLMIDPLDFDYHLGELSPAIDLCGASLPGLGVDFDGDPRPAGGGYDAGADEVGAATLVFSDGFESGNTSAWSATVP